MNRSSCAGCFFRIVAVVLGLQNGGQVLAITSVSQIPELDYYADMKRIVGVSETDAWVTSFAENGPLIHLAYDGWEWTEVARHLVTDWLGIPRLSGEEIFSYGDEVLILDTSHVLSSGVNVPAITVLQNEAGGYRKTAKVTMESILGSAEYFSSSVEDVIQTTDLLLLRMSVGVLGTGGQLWQHCFVRTAAGWQTGPGLQLSSGYWWPLFSERIGEELHLYAMRMEGIYDGTPQLFTVHQYRFANSGWEHLGQVAEFTDDPKWVASTYVRTLVSGDGASVLLFSSDEDLNPVRPTELKRPGGSWIHAGSPEWVTPTGAPPFMTRIGNGMALLRSLPDSGPAGFAPQHYHLLKYIDGNWTLVGDVVSHREFGDYWRYGLSHCLMGDRLTVFDFSRFNEAARSYSLDDLRPICIKWFRQSITLADGWASLSAFGYFQPTFSDSRSGMWLWHANLGWIYAAGRDAGQFWGWHASMGWLWFSDQLFDVSHGKSWLYVPMADDILWFEVRSAQPLYFYSYHYAEWVSELEAPNYDAASIAWLAEALTSELATAGIAFEWNADLSLAIFSMSGVSEGRQILIRIEAPWQYNPHVDYPSHATFALDLSWILVTVDGQTAGLHASELWSEAGLIVPMALNVDLFFLTPDSGYARTVITYNNGCSGAPLREPFSAEAPSSKAAEGPFQTRNGTALRGI